MIFLKSYGMHQLIMGSKYNFKKYFLLVGLSILFFSWASPVYPCAVNDPPVVTAGGTISYTEGDGATVIDSTITVSDGDDTYLQGATITISTGYHTGEDELGFLGMGEIAGVFNASSGELTLSGCDTVANYEAALRSVTYVNTGGDDPTAGARKISFVVNDGIDDSNTVTSTVEVAAENDAPVLGGGGGILNYTENNAATPIDNSVTVTDVDDTDIETATVTISVNYKSGEDVLGFTDTGSISGSFSAGMLTLTGTDIVANYQAALRSVTYSNTSDDPSTDARTISFVVNDGDDNSVAVTRNVLCPRRKKHH
jgi:hypothetical protein